eukprot:GHVS01038617.1.p1 GENE.GHVS01038617.1~~GHVS01038617.1.p1  ORF type:complete len:401 (-),score=117.67 GHVS01038617.1:184-1386(-)
MLGCLAEKVWGSQLVTDESPGRTSTAASPTAGEEIERTIVGVEDLSCSLWEVDGTDAKEAIEEAKVCMEKDSVVFTAVLQGGAGGGGVGKKEFRFVEMVSFHQQEEDIFQWLIKKNSESVEEFGVVFPNSAQAEMFNACIRPKLRGTATVLCKEPVEFREYVKKEWQTVEDNATIVLLQRAKDKQGFLCVFAAAEEEKVLSEIGVSHDEYIFPQPTEQQVCWWGVGNANGNDKRMFAAKLLGPNMDKTFEILQKVIGDHVGVGGGGGAEAQYDNGDFVMKTALEEDIEWVDAEEISADEVVCRDSTRRLAAANPKSKLHKLMFVGSNRTFVVRAGASAGRLSGGCCLSAELEVMKISGEGEHEVVGTVAEDKIAMDGHSLWHYYKEYQGVRKEEEVVYIQ